MGTTATRSLLVALFAAALTGPVTCAAASAADLPAAHSQPAVAAAATRGPLLGWGLNEFGELGTGDAMDRTTPVRVNDPHTLLASSARIGNFLVAVNSAGQVYTAGQGTQGELGTGVFTDHSWRPVKVRLPRGVKVRAAREGYQFAVAVTTAGKVTHMG